ncbi:FAD/NAD(P)-binding protein [Aestuariimicrobium sp. Y1814]|uniref:FAD/NAD(P)-binding protein n=1 Tax=Aestuariimicrobium sp. Y1814 TaxID=3418742 RepID=UPI003DA71CAE
MSTDIMVVGVGPRGTIVLGRLAAHLRHRLEHEPDRVPPIRLHLVEPTQFGAGAVWRTDQPADLCMNTLAAGSTLFTDDSWTGPGPQASGPTFYAWAQSVTDARRTDDGVDLSDFAHELDQMLPWAHPSRALFGHYSAWAFRRAVADLVDTGRVSVVEHRTRAVALRASGDEYLVGLADGAAVRVAAVVLALGWVPVRPGAADADLIGQVEADDADDLVWVGPDSPIEQDLSAIQGDQRVLVRGLGMGFFDVMSQLTIGRGGRFETLDDWSSGAGLVYRPSGNEPVLHVASDRGVPFLAKTRYGSMPPKPAMSNLRAALAAAPRPLPVAELWPAILRDSITEHARVLVRTRPDDLTDPETLVPELDALPAGVDLDEVRRVAARHLPEALRFEPTDWEDPAAAVEFTGPDDVDAFVQNLLTRDLAEADRGHDSAIKAGLWAISVARMHVGLSCTFDNVDATGDQDLRRLMRWGGMLGSGPPAFRNEQLLALCEAGLVHFVGPRVQVRVRDGQFEMWSPRVPDSTVRSTVLVDAWMRNPHATRAADPLVAGLLANGLARPLRRPGPDGEPVDTGSVDIVAETGEVIGADSQPVPGLFMIGIPVDGARRDTIQAPVPGIDSNTLHEADAVAARLLDLVAARDLKEAS